MFSSATAAPARRALVSDRGTPSSHSGRNLGRILWEQRHESSRIRSPSKTQFVKLPETCLGLPIRCDATGRYASWTHAGRCPGADTMWILCDSTAFVYLNVASRTWTGQSKLHSTFGEITSASSLPSLGYSCLIDIHSVGR